MPAESQALISSSQRQSYALFNIQHLVPAYSRVCYQSNRKSSGLKRHRVWFFWFVCYCSRDAEAGNDKQTQSSRTMVSSANPFFELPDPSKSTEYKKGYFYRKCVRDPGGGPSEYFFPAISEVLYLQYPEALGFSYRWLGLFQMLSSL